MNAKKFLKSFLCASNIKLPYNNSHYITGKELSIFSNLVCVENTLSNFTNNISCITKSIKSKYKR